MKLKRPEHITRPFGIPTLDNIVNAFDARKIAELPPGTVLGLFHRAAAAQAKLGTALAQSSLDGARREPEARHNPERDRWLTVDQACERSALSRRWFYKRAGHARLRVGPSPEQTHHSRS